MKDHQDNIDRYLNGAMEEEDKRSFLLLLDGDPALRQEFDKQEKLAELIRLAAMQEELQSIHAEMEAAPAPVKRISDRWWWLAAAAILLFVIGRNLYIGSAHRPEEKLYAAWYDPEPGLPTLMGAGQNDNGLMEAMVDYKTRDYSSAIPRFRALLSNPGTPSPGTSHTDTVTFFYLASSYMAAGNYDSAYLIFGKLTAAGDHYGQLAQWYEALTCLRLGKREEAVSFLQKIASDPTHPYREKAIKLRKALEGLPPKNS
jgi:tetratricopeptide (TPR) repeat protein